MTSLIKDAISTMGQPESTKPRSMSASESTSASSSMEINSIPLSMSFRDWWSSCSQLMRHSTSCSQMSEAVRKARFKNTVIEYDLFRAILSDDIYIEEPVEEKNAEEKGRQPENEVQDEEPHTRNVPLYAELLDIEIDEDVSIHELYLVNNTDPSVTETHLVIIHGYMAALGYFVKNVEPLLKSQPGLRLHVIDLPGFGNSSRPTFPKEFLTEPKTKAEKIKQIVDIENWFIDKLECWRKKRGIKKFKLVGHSMGAYLSCCYLMKYNKASDKVVDEFIAVSPMGTESSYNSLLNNKKHQKNYHGDEIDPFREIVDFDEEDVVTDELRSLWESLGQPKFPKNYILEKIWKYNKSPFQILQNFGPFYSKILSYWSYKRFRNLKTNEDEAVDEDVDTLVTNANIKRSYSESSAASVKSNSSLDLILKLHSYSYSIFNQYQGSGEIAITKFINHEILARLPLCDRGLVEYLNETLVKSLWVYGDKDWMNQKGGLYIHDKLKEINPEISDFKIIEDAGHHIYLDNPESFNKTCIDFFHLCA
ncbi:hypothetical protein G9P44_004063 [Scheffersomyces stipitis]|nr:hypothetical protein G9P44_004063 [Scheffersomyces stipitis]